MATVGRGPGAFVPLVPPLTVLLPMVSSSNHVSSGLSDRYNYPPRVSFVPLTCARPRCGASVRFRKYPVNDSIFRLSLGVLSGDDWTWT